MIGRDDDLAAAGDDLRDLIETSLVYPRVPAPVGAAEGGPRMSAAETIQAAIDRLEGLAVAASYSEYNGWLTEANAVDDWGRYEATPITNDPLIVTLHRTVDAQLAILRESQTLAKLGIDPEGDPWGQQPVLDLARAILGEES